MLDIHAFLQESDEHAKSVLQMQKEMREHIEKASALASSIQVAQPLLSKNLNKMEQLFLDARHMLELMPFDGPDLVRVASNMRSILASRRLLKDADYESTVFTKDYESLFDRFSKPLIMEERIYRFRQKETYDLASTFRGFKKTPMLEPTTKQSSIYPLFESDKVSIGEYDSSIFSMHSGSLSHKEFQYRILRKNDNWAMLDIKTDKTVFVNKKLSSLLEYMTRHEVSRVFIVKDKFHCLVHQVQQMIDGSIPTSPIKDKTFAYLEKEFDFIRK